MRSARGLAAGVVAVLIGATAAQAATPEPPLDAQGQKVVHRAMAAVYDGPITVHVHLDLEPGSQSRRKRAVDVRPARADRPT